MAPVCLACRLQLSCFLLFLSDVSFTCCTRLVYARQALLDIRISVGDSFANSHTVDVECPLHKPYEPPRTIFLHDICRWPLNTVRRKRRRKRGSRGGYMTKLKAYLQADISFGRRSVAWHPRDAVYRCLRPVFPLHLSHATQVDLRSVGRLARRNGVNHGNLRSLRKAPSSHVSIPPPKLALINARSVVNKTFLLNDFYSSHNLDFMFITESWIKVGDLTPLSELVPANCTFFNSPRPNGRGGGILTILNNSLSSRCRMVPATAFPSFETQLLHLDWNGPTCIGVIYRPPLFTKDFILQFTEFIGNIATNYDRFLLMGDFNIHVCCHSNSLSQEFLDLIDAFNLLQWVKNPTHTQGHTLDLVLSYGIDVTDIVISDFPLSDHKPILFSLSLLELPQPTIDPVMSRFYSPQFNTNFDLCFTELCSHLHLDQPLSDLDADQHLSLLNSAWLKVANVTAPLKPHKPKPKSDMWQNSDTRHQRQICRKAERKWKRDRLSVSFRMFKDSLTAYQNTAKSAKAAYFSNLIESNHSNPKVLFSVIHSVLNPSAKLSVASDALCEDFQRFFINKITKLRISICPNLTLPPIMPRTSCVWEAFVPINLQTLKDVSAKLKPSFCPNDIIHP